MFDLFTRFRYPYQISILIVFDDPCLHQFWNMYMVERRMDSSNLFFRRLCNRLLILAASNIRSQISQSDCLRVIYQARKNVPTALIGEEVENYIERLIVQVTVPT